MKKTYYVSYTKKTSTLTDDLFLLSDLMLYNNLFRQPDTKSYKYKIKIEADSLDEAKKIFIKSVPLSLLVEDSKVFFEEVVTTITEVNSKEFASVVEDEQKAKRYNEYLRLKMEFENKVAE